jgi:AmmeMemoRadiSam system protein A
MEPEDKRRLLAVARRAIEQGVNQKPLESLENLPLPARVWSNGACFVTLTIGGALRGCIGSLVALRPLVEDVQEHALDAAVNDYRFPPVRPDEVPRLHIELSVLSTPARLDYSAPADLLRTLRPGVDGVILESGRRRATFLPQVWEKVPDPAEFLGMLCEKMGLAGDAWQHQRMTVSTYQVESFEEEK